MRVGDEGIHRGVARSSADAIRRKDAKELAPVLVITVYGQPAVSRSVEVRLARENGERCVQEFDGKETGQIFADAIHPSEEPRPLARWDFFPEAPQ